MAITRLTQSGFESGQFTALPEGFDAGVMNLDAASQHTGTYCGLERWVGNQVHKQTGNIRQIRSGFWADISTAGTRIRFAVRDAGLNLLVDLEFKVTSGNIALEVDGVEEDELIGGVTGGYLHYGMDVKIDNAAGWAVCYINGIEVLSFAGDTGNVDIFEVVWGGISGGGDVWSYWDDIYLDDTTGEGAAAPVPILRFPWLVPNANGNYSQWDPSAAVDHYTLVDERPPSAADYVDTATVDEFDSYEMSNYALGVNEIPVALIPTVRVKRGDVTEEIAIGSRYSGTDLIGSDQVPSAAVEHFFERQTTKPGGGAWTQAALDGAEVVVKSRGSY